MRAPGTAIPVSLASALLLLAGAMAVGCSTKNVVTCKANQGYDPKQGVCYDCPPGTKVDYANATCVKGTPPDVLSDSSGAEPEVKDIDQPPPDETGGDAPGTTDMPDGGVKSDAAEKDLAPEGSIGASCNMDADCQEGLSCFDWPGGYCIQPDCTFDDDCPEGSACLPLLQNGLACFDGCTTDSGCRDGYGCKAIPASGGIAKAVCHPVEDDKKLMGEACTGHAECAGSLACIKLGPQSMCSMTGCSSFDPCPDGAACVPWGIMTICLPTCEDTQQCVEMASEAFTCQEMEDIEDGDVSVCSAAQQGLPVGELCFFPTECETGYCHLLISGKCSGPDGSLCGSDEDCPEGLCIGDPGVQKGVCSQPCGPGETCPSAAYCVMTGDGPLCLATCSNYGGECGPSGFQMSCTYGTIYYPSAPSGKYACAKSFGGEGGSPCGDTGDCKSGFCYGVDEKDGYCATECVLATDCPFGTQCQQDTLMAGQMHCSLLCFHDLDCDEGYSCKNTFYSEKACLLD